MEGKIMTLEPTKTNVLVIQRRQSKSASGMILLATQDQKADKFCEVLAVGPDVENVKVGDVVFVDISAGSLVDDTDDGITGVIDEDEILLIRRDTND